MNYELWENILQGKPEIRDNHGHHRDYHTDYCCQFGIFLYKNKANLFESLQEKGKTTCDNLSRSAKYSVLTEDKTALEELVAGAMWSG